MSNDAAESARELVAPFLEASMIPGPVSARTFMAADAALDSRLAASPNRASTVFNAKGTSVKQRFERSDVVAGANAGEANVYNTDTQHRACPGRTAFDENGAAARFVVHDGLMAGIDVWNDGVEIVLTRAGLAEDLRQVTEPRAAGKAR